MKESAFSIIELLVVITIVSILSVIAIPIYKTYSMKSKFMEAVSMLQECKKKIDVTFQETDQFPNTVCGATLNGSPINFNSNTIAQIEYGGGTWGGQLPSNGIWLYAFMNTNVIPEGATNPAYGTIYIGGIVSPTQHKIMWYCGTWATTGFLPSSYLQYLPPECNSPSVSLSLKNVT